MEEDAKLLETIVKALVSEPDKAKVSRKVDEMGVLLELDVALADMGTVIGKQGKTAQALRTILRAFGARNNSRVNLKITEPEGSTRTPREDVRTSSEDSGEPKAE